MPSPKEASNRRDFSKSCMIFRPVFTFPYHMPLTLDFWDIEILFTENNAQKRKGSNVDNEISEGNTKFKEILAIW